MNTTCPSLHKHLKLLVLRIANLLVDPTVINGWFNQFYVLLFLSLAVNINNVFQLYLFKCEPLELAVFISSVLSLHDAQYRCDGYLRCTLARSPTPNQFKSQKRTRHEELLNDWRGETVKVVIYLCFWWSGSFIADLPSTKEATSHITQTRRGRKICCLYTRLSEQFTVTIASVRHVQCAIWNCPWQNMLIKQQNAHTHRSPLIIAHHVKLPPATTTTRRRQRYDAYVCPF